MATTPEQVIARRRAERTELLRRAGSFAAEIQQELDVVAVVVFGSVARGDFHEASDVDVLIVAEGLPARSLDRNEAVGVPPLRVEFVAWTPSEWRAELARRNPIATEAVARGVWLEGSPEVLD